MRSEWNVCHREPSLFELHGSPRKHSNIQWRMKTSILLVYTFILYCITLDIHSLVFLGWRMFLRHPKATGDMCSCFPLFLLCWLLYMWRSYEIERPVSYLSVAIMKVTPIVTSCFVVFSTSNVVHVGHPPHYVIMTCHVVTRPGERAIGRKSKV